MAWRGFLACVSVAGNGLCFCLPSLPFFCIALGPFGPEAGVVKRKRFGGGGLADIHNKRGC